MKYEYKKVDSNNITGAELTALISHGWKAMGKLEDKVDDKDKVVIAKSHIIRLRRPIGEESEDDVVLSPDKVFAKLGVKIK